MPKTENIRHSLAHIMAHAVKDLYPEAVFGMGPAIDNGFYYDFDNIKINEEDLSRIEERMREIIEEGVDFEKSEISKKEAEKLFFDQPYKLEIIKEMEGDSVSVYTSGDFTDICSGPHVKSSKEINKDAFKLTRTAGAYWKGSEENPMLARIYGVAFADKESLEEYLRKEAEMKKRDHRLIGEKLELFITHKDVGPGLVLWLPNGAVLKKVIEDYAISEYTQNGYQLVSTPHVSKSELLEISGHNNFYGENMFPLMHMQADKEDYQIKPMNCPFHVQIYKNKMRSYNDLPIRYTEMGTVYRYEKSGTVHGLTRVRGFTQDDGHIFTTKEGIQDELYSALQLTMKILKKFGFEKFNVYLSTKPEKHVGSEEIWNIAEKSLQNALEKMKIPFEIDAEEGVFYGPKIDIKIEDALGREWQCSTIQLDFNLPERFDMTYVNSKGEKERPIMIHRALLGSLERFIGVLLEYHAGDLPLWIAPLQARIIPVSKEQEGYANEVKDKLSSLIRVSVDKKNETLGKKIREGEMSKIPYLLVVGAKEKDSKKVSVRYKGEDQGSIDLPAFIETVKKNL